MPPTTMIVPCSEASPSPCEVFLGGSCNPTTWRSEIAIPYLKKMGITYFNPQVDDWSTELVEVEHKAKASARALLFVLDSETRAVAASVEAAHLAAAPRDLLLVLRPYTRHQTIGRETISDQEYVELSRARATLQEAVERRGLPAFTDIPAALRCARAVLRGARTHPRQPLGQTILRLKRAFDAVGGRTTRLSRSLAIDALKNVTQAPIGTIERCLPTNMEQVDFETFCAAVAEIAADGESQPRHGHSSESAATPDARERVGEPVPARHENAPANERLKAYGRKLKLNIPMSGSPAESRTAGTTPGVLTPGTEHRLQALPAMLSSPPTVTHHQVYLAGSFPSKGPRPEDILRREGVSFVFPRANDYTRMFSTPARRSAPEHPESPRTDKKPRPSFEDTTKSLLSANETARLSDDEVELRDRSTSAEPEQRLSASDFYSVNEDVTPQPFKGTFDEELLLGCGVLVFAASADSPAFATLVQAAHYSGLRPRRCVLLVQPLDGVNTAYSAAAVKDYNRGRHYLTDLARRAGVPVVDSTEAAIAAAIQIVRQDSH